MAAASFFFFIRRSVVTYLLRRKAMRKMCPYIHENVAWFFPAFWSWYGFYMQLVSYYGIVMAPESRAAPRSLGKRTPGPCGGLYYTTPSAKNSIYFNFQYFGIP